MTTKNKKQDFREGKKGDQLEKLGDRKGENIMIIVLLTRQRQDDGGGENEGEKEINNKLSTHKIILNMYRIMTDVSTIFSI